MKVPEFEEIVRSVSSYLGSIRPYGILKVVYHLVKGDMYKLSYEFINKLKVIKSPDFENAVSCYFSLIS